jgi:ketosteroid isomerase-like protein
MSRMTPERLAEFGEAWNRHDPDLLLSYMTEDCSYQASFGPELLGRDFRGRAAVREGFAAFFAAYPDGRFEDSRVHVFAEHGAACEWTFAWTAPDGSRDAGRGCDLYEFEGDRIRRKNAFRKQPPG